MDGTPAQAEAAPEISAKAAKAAEKAARKAELAEKKAARKATKGAAATEGVKDENTEESVGDAGTADVDALEKDLSKLES
jgi:hypothetical protein